MSPRTEQQFENIRIEKIELIKKSALKLFAENGYQSTSISQIAKQAKISKGLMYNYFKSKENLLHDIMFSGLEDFKNSLIVKDINKINKGEIINFIDVNIDLLKSKPEFYRLYFSLAMQSFIVKLFEDEMQKMFGEIFHKFILYYTQQNEKNPYAKTRFLIAAFDGIGIHYLQDIKNFPLDEARQMMIELI